MSKHKRRQRQEEVSAIEEDNNVKNNPNNNPNNNMNGFDLASIAGLINRINVNDIAAIVNNFNSELSKTENNSTNPDQNSEVEIKRNEIRKSLETLINADRAEVIQAVLALYAVNKGQNK